MGLTGTPVPLPLGEVALRSNDGEGKDATEKNKKRSDSIALTKGLFIAARRLSGDRLALSVTFGDSSPKGGALKRLPPYLQIPPKPLYYI